MPINQYFNKKVNDVFLLYIMYVISAPLAHIFISYKIKPNTITTLSNLSAVISYFFIFYNFYFFAFFWTLALILDICDGIVARATNQSNAFGSFYDHFSDVLKILVLYFIIAIYYDISTIWILISLNMLTFATVDYLDGVYGKKIIIIRNHKSMEINVGSSDIPKQKIKSPIGLFYKKITNTITYKTLFIMHGQYNLILIPLAFNETLCKYTLLLTLIITIWSSITMIRAISNKNRMMMEENISWK